MEEASIRKKEMHVSNIRHQVHLVTWSCVRETLIVLKPINTKLTRGFAPDEHKKKKMKRICHAMGTRWGERL